MHALELTHDLQQAVGRARALELRRFEDQPARAVVQELVPQVAEVLSAGAEALDRVFRHYESRPAADAEEGVTDLSFMGRMELMGQRRRLGELASVEDGWLVLAECGSGQRALLRSGAAVERAILRAEGLPRPEAGPGLELEVSLQVRAAYARLRRELSALEDPTPGQVAARLRQVSERLGGFTGSPIFEEVRLGDRLELKRLLARCQGWLAAPDREGRAGVRLWQDLTGCAALLSQINLREELLEHDRRLVRELGAALGSARPPTWLPGPLLGRLHALYGRDDGVDGLLDAGSGLLAVEWREPLARLQDALRLPAGDDFELDIEVDAGALN